MLAHCFTTLKTGNKSTSRALQKSIYKIQCCREMPNAQSKAITMGTKPFLKSHLTFFTSRVKVTFFRRRYCSHQILNFGSKSMFTNF